MYLKQGNLKDAVAHWQLSSKNGKAHRQPKRDPAEVAKVQKKLESAKIRLARNRDQLRITQSAVTRGVTACQGIASPSGHSSRRKWAQWGFDTLVTDFRSVSLRSDAFQEMPPPATDDDARQKATSQPAATTPPPIKPAPKLTDAEMELFLKSAQKIGRKKLDTGTTGASGVTQSDGKLTHDVQFQGLDLFKPVFRGRRHGREELSRTYKFNIAAYRVAKLIGIETIPMSVERDLDGRLGSITWWLDNVWIAEVERREKGIKPPATTIWVDPLNIVRVFDQLISNTDRNQGNLLITPEWRVWMIDHTRAFRTTVGLQKKNALPGRVDHKLLRGLRELNTVQLKQALGRILASGRDQRDSWAPGSHRRSLRTRDQAEG